MMAWRRNRGRPVAAQVREFGVELDRQDTTRPRAAMSRLIASLSLGVLLAATNPATVSAAEVKTNEVAAALGGSWDRGTAQRSQLVKTGSLIPATCSPGRFTAAKRGRTVDYYGSKLGRYPRRAYTDVLTYASARAAKRGLRGLRDWVKQCPGPTQSCTGCDGGALHLAALGRARLGRPSFGWWSASPGGMEAAYTTSIAFVKGKKMGVASYMIYDTQNTQLDRSFVVSIPKTKALAARLKQRM